MSAERTEDKAPHREVVVRAGDRAKDASGAGPLGSLVAVAVGWAVLWVVGALYGAMLVSIAPSLFPVGAPPEHAGLMLWLAGAVPNGILAGLVCGRIAPVSPLAHGGVLAGVIGYFAMMSSDQATGTPWWNALGRILVPALAILVGGWIAHRRAALTTNDRER